MGRRKGEPEPRRSVRATKGQHTKSFDDQPIEPPKKRGRKKKQEEEPEEEIIRCVCGATEQDGDSEEPWIACDKCTAWQHNVCMGMSVFTEDLPKNYYCEQCAPQDHKDLLAAMAKGERPWEARRKAYEEEQNEKKKKKKKGGRGGKRASDPKEDLSQDARSTKVEDSPAPSEVKEKKEKKDGTSKLATGKRKARDEEKEAKVGRTRLEPQGSSNVNSWRPQTPAQKVRKVSEPDPTPVVNYTAPADLTAKVADLPEDRKGSAQLLQKALAGILVPAVKDKSIALPKDVTVAAKAERLALEIERAVHDSHPDRSNYAAQARALYANMKINADLTKRLLKRTLSPLMLATMSADELATKERQDANAQLKAISEKQSILITDDGPRVRRTHKGEEIVENESFQQSEESRSFIRRPTARTDGEYRYDGAVDIAHGGLHIDTQGARHSPKHPDFDINKVFSSVKSPTGSHTRRPSAPIHGPGVDPDVDRLLQDETDSPPYSPTDETDPDVVWRGSLHMNSIADFPAAAKFAAGANLSSTIGLPWTELIPKKLEVAGRIDKQKAIEYLCSLRYADQTDIVVVSLLPASEGSRKEFQQLFDYFVAKERYAVIGDKRVPNVRDTYLVPVPAGEGNVPEFMLNFCDNLVPQKRTEPMLLGVFVYRNSPRQQGQQTAASQSPVTNSPTPTQRGFPPRHPSISGPAFSPTVPQGPFPQPGQPQPGHAGYAPQQHPTQGAHHVVPPNQPPPGYTAPRGPEADIQQQRQREGQAIAREILGPLINSKTVPFLMPHAYQMSRTEWEVIKGIYERDPQSREDLAHLSKLLEQQPPAEPQAPPAAAPQGVAPSA
ncbi:phd finger domain-containing protein [Colletotrichum musicola]|uniref:Transcription factor BYE1 n=1 Tax=Colletotrichum musicola TaxID=2175873 RepID=A0A8H6J406_9PEZI|nr:phd finger domain-containing protein [Colletotrichum musicola]